ncbi:chromodomain protein, putative [Plasmopara halstedii]|uniref:Chromodomain protein, putative n=1 Tax=Plasmopara halstedii TaxID=4781 RepID=A0A0P1B0N9_PLAHL|nr:chromodomain protein, putative [Plasmopara halstedii]CEG46762.1 chromodomain protein, putative [Plasmopara halstedii]|eukprot:XP_024583131.1 chromodomain protein, putative [Plasmopara halstedii]
MEKVSEARREGDADEDKAMIAEMMKLIGNSAFGRSGMDKGKHKETKYKSCDGSISSIVEQKRFYDVEELGDSFKITLKKKCMKLNDPIHLSIAI